MIQRAKTGKRSTALLALALAAGLGVIAGLVELAGAIVPAPERPASSVDSGQAEPRIEPQVVKLDDHSVEIRVGAFHRSTIRLGQDESVDPLVECLREGIERAASELDTADAATPRRGWLFQDPLNLRINDAARRIQNECLATHVPRPLGLPEIPAAGS